MKKTTIIFMLWILFFIATPPVSRADEGEDTRTAPDATPQEVASMEKTLRSERLDNIEQSMSGLQETINALTERVQDLERTVFDDNGRT